MTPATPSGELLRVGSVYFVSDFRYIAQPLCDMVPIVLDPSWEWLHRALGPCGRSEDAQDADASHPRTSPAVWSDASGLAGVDTWPDGGASPLRVYLGPPRERGTEIVIPIVWDPVRPGFLFPRLEGDLTLSEVDGRTCRLGLTGRYRPPLAATGGCADRVWLRPVAECSVRNFLEDVELALLACVEARPSAPAPPGDGVGGPRP
jgi:hypothetical protein